MSDRLQALYDWIRKPDWEEHFGQDEIVAWLNDRPCSTPLAAKAHIEFLERGIASAHDHKVDAMNVTAQQGYAMAQDALDAKDATIADLERRLAEALTATSWHAPLASPVSILTPKQASDLKENGFSVTVSGGDSAAASELRTVKDCAARALARAGQYAEEAEIAEARADALQARLTEAEQHAATAERRGFEAGRDAAADAVDHLVAIGVPDKVLAGHVRALTPPDAPQEGETTP